MTTCAAPRASRGVAVPRATRSPPRRPSSLQVSVVERESWEDAVFVKTNKAAHRFTNRDRHTVLRWRKFQPLFERIARTKGEKARYIALPVGDIKIDI